MLFEAFVKWKSSFSAISFISLSSVNKNIYTVIIFGTGINYAGFYMSHYCISWNALVLVLVSVWDAAVLTSP